MINISHHLEAVEYLASFISSSHPWTGTRSCSAIRGRDESLSFADSGEWIERVGR